MRQLAPCAVLILATLAVASEACAQQSAPQRALTWAGRPAVAVPAESQGAALAPSGLIPHAGTDVAPPTGVAAAMPVTPDRVRRQGLTPADVWLPVSGATQAVATAPSAASGLPPQPPAPPPGSAAHAAYVPPVQTTPPAYAQPADAGAPAPSSAPPVGGRYYSVHRPNGRQPDAVLRPEPVYLDGVTVDRVDAAPAEGGEDLAAPPAPASMVRDANGVLRPAPTPIEHDIQ